MIDYVNHHRKAHIVTLEDPVEYLYKPDLCAINQREIGKDTRSFSEGLRASLREDPNVILIGEMRDKDTIETAITAAETGHLVFTTLHAGDTVGAVERLVAVFPAEEQESVRRQLALVLRGIFAQHLLPPRQRGARRVACCELLFATPAVAHLIATGRSKQIQSVLELSAGIGMQTLEQSRDDLVRRGLIDPTVAP